jgi:RHS repeat-associated protein
VPSGVLAPGSRYQAQVSVTDGTTAPVIGAWRRFDVVAEDPVPDPTVSVPELVLGTAVDPTEAVGPQGYEPNGNSDLIQDLGAETPDPVAKSATVTLNTGSYTAPSALKPIAIQRIGGSHALNAENTPEVEQNAPPGTTVEQASVNVTWEPITPPLDETVPDETDPGETDPDEIDPDEIDPIDSVPEEVLFDGTYENDPGEVESAETDEALEAETEEPEVGPASEFEVTLGAVDAGSNQALVDQVTEIATENGVATEFDYSEFAKTFGGNWVDRLVVKAYPACYATTPEVEACAQAVVVPSVNDRVNQKLLFTAPPVETTAAQVPTATAAGAAAANTDDCWGGDSSETGSEPVLPFEEPAPPAVNEPVPNTDGTVAITEADLEAEVEPYPLGPGEEASTSLADADAADKDLDADNNGVEDDETGEGSTLPEQPSAEAAEAVVAPPMLDKADAVPCAGMTTRLASEPDTYGTPPSASTINPSGSWQVGEGSGEFSWNYPFAMPPGIGDEVPGLALSYSSGTVDGMTTADNGQGSAAGLGWTMDPGYISRSYRPCSTDGLDDKGDLCWFTASGGRIVNELALSLGGHNTRLVNVSTTGTGANAQAEWRLADDPGWKVSSTRTGAGMRFTITDTGGTVYRFGGVAGSNGVWTVPVYGNNSNEECHESALKDSWCMQPWRWNLESVTTANGNKILYQYATETNAYKRWGTTMTNYDAAGRLTKIFYGYERGGDHAGKPSVQVTVNSTGRCNSLLNHPTTGDCDPKNPAQGDTVGNGPRERPTIWPDVPVDLICTTARDESCSNISPSFFSRKRYSTITTRIIKPANGAATDLVDQYTLIHSMPDPDHQGRGDEPNLWLRGVKHTSSTLANTEAMTTWFKGQTQRNRVTVPDGKRQYRKYRVTYVRNETGGRVLVKYGHDKGHNCTASNVKSRKIYEQDLECFAQRRAEPGKKPVWEWFHKYLVKRLWVGDDTTGLKGDQSAERATNSSGKVRVYDYVYEGEPAWRFDPSENVQFKDRSWNDWRGYDTVQIRTRRIADDNSILPGSVSIRRVVRYRGMSNTRLDLTNDGGRKNIKITTVEHPEGELDLPRLAGRVAEETVLEGGADGKWASRTYHGYEWVKTADNGGARTAHMVQENLTRTYTRVRLDPGHPRITQITRGFNRPTDPRSIMSGAQLIEKKLSGWVNDQHKIEHGAPVCTYTKWARSDTYWIRAPRDVRVKTALNCADPISRVTTYYDQATTANPASISNGRPTTVVTKDAKLFTVDAPEYTTTASYDVYGRIGRSTNARGKATTYDYNTANSRLARTSSITMTAPDTTPVTTQVEPERLQPTLVVDENGNSTTYKYDSFGRVTSYKSPRHNKLATEKPTLKFEYAVNVAKPSVTTTTTRRGDQSFVYYDGWGRTIETQRPGPNYGKGRLVSETRYDESGRAVISIPAYYQDKTAGSDVSTAQLGSNALRKYTSTDYDVLGRVIETRQHESGGGVYAKSSTSYGTVDGEHRLRVVDISPRETKTVTILDRNGYTDRIEQYDGTEQTGYQLAHAADYKYGGTGQLQSITSNIGGTNKTWSYEYDLAGRRTKATDPDTGETTYEYHDDEPGSEAYTTVTSPSIAADETAANPNPKVTYRTDYDTRGRPTKVRRVTGSTLESPISTWAYDDGPASGNFKGRLVSETSKNGDLGTFTRTIGGYDENGNPTEVTTTADLNGPSSSDPGQIYKASETYEYTDDRPTKVTYGAIKAPGTNTVVLPETTLRYEYTTNAALKNMYVPAAGTKWYLANVGYRKSGKTSRIESGNNDELGKGSPPGGIARTYKWDDPIGRLSAIRSTGYGALQYSYDKNNNPTRVDAVNGEVTQTSWCYTYDGLDRLKSADTGSGGTCTAAGGSYDGTYRGGTQEQRLQYEYEADRLKSVTSNDGSTTRTAGYTYYPGTHRTQQIAYTGAGTDPYLPAPTLLTYDQAGRVTKQSIFPRTGPWAGTAQVTDYTYNRNGTLASTTYPCSTTTTARLDFGYDTTGLRTTRKLTGCGTDTTVVTLGATEITTAGGATTARRHYATPGGTPLAIQAGATHGAEAWTWLFSDQQNNIRYTKKQTGGTTRPTYLPFGDPAVDTVPVLEGERGYLNKTQDPNGELRLDHRTYNAALNILTTPDPLLNTSDPQSLNPYAYSRNNPITLTDPSGLDPCAACKHPESGLPLGPDEPGLYDGGSDGSDDSGGTSDSGSAGNATINDVAFVIQLGLANYPCSADDVACIYEYGPYSLWQASLTVQATHINDVLAPLEPIGRAAEAFVGIDENCSGTADCAEGPAITAAMVLIPGVDVFKIASNANRARKAYLAAQAARALEGSLSPTLQAGGTSFIFGNRVLGRAVEAGDSYHNFPASFDIDILTRGTRTEISEGYVKYTLRGSINGRQGIYEIGARPSGLADAEVITHRAFKPGG